MEQREHDLELDIRHAGFFVFRTPLLPFEVLLDWAKDMTAARVNGGSALEEAITRDKAELRDRLRVIVNRPAVLEALSLASPATCEVLEGWLPSHAIQDTKLVRTLTRYVQRMAARSTPFGLFAGCSVGRSGDTTNIAIAPIGEYRRYSRLDNDHLLTLTDYLARQPELRRAFRYEPNSSLYRLGGRWRYVSAASVDGKRRFNLVALDADEYLDETLKQARDGKTIAELTEGILNADADGDISRDEAMAYVTELIDRQVLVSPMSPVVTGPEGLDDVIDQLVSIAPRARVTSALEDVRQQLKAIDGMPIGVDIERYRTIQRTLEPLGVKTDPARLFQVDLIKPAPHATCGAAVLEEISRGVRLLHRLAPGPRNESLRRFREAFTARYERREVPLFEVLDEESGIGFDRSAAPTAENVPLLNGIPLSTGEGGSTSRDVFLLSKLDARSEGGGEVLELSEADVNRLANAQPGALPDAFSVLAVLDAATSNPDADFRVLIHNVIGPSGAKLLGRFCHADHELHTRVLDHLAIEESLRPDAVLAEVVHLPEGRLGNILARPLLRQFEITYLGRSGAPLARQIPVSDLRVAVRDDRVILRSARLGTEVIPRMTNAHNFSRGQGIYRFLCALQMQDIIPWLGWSWGTLETAPFLPRVVHGRIVLSRARWWVGKELLATMVTGPFHQQFASIQQWRLARRLPRFVALVEGDNELPVDFENVLSVETLLQLVKKREAFTLVEMFPQPEGLCAHGPEGRFSHELIVPFVSHANAEARARPTRERAVPCTQRSFPPGSEWLYLKWYGGTASVDSILTEIVPDLMRRQTDSGTVHRWFFVRYPDPEWHLRLRLHGERDRLLTLALADAHGAAEPALKDGRIWRVQIDTYERELERYGGDIGMALSEEIFWRDSEAVLEILQSVTGDQGIDARWQLCLRAWDLFLSDMGFTLEVKRELTKAVRTGLGRRLRANKTTDRALGDKFRSQRKSLEALFDDRQHSGHPLADALNILTARSAALEPVIYALQAHDTAGRLAVPLTTLAGSYLHMHANRMLRSAHQAQEFVLYDFLDRLYESQAARARGRGAARRRPVQMPAEAGG